jgi:hypothetical protein
MPANGREVVQCPVSPEGPGPIDVQTVEESGVEAIANPAAQLLAAQHSYIQSRQATDALAAELKTNPGQTPQQAAGKLGIDLSAMRTVDRQLLEAQAAALGAGNSGGQSSLIDNLLAGIQFIRG